MRFINTFIEDNNMKRAFEVRALEFFLDLLFRLQGSEPARACMLKIVTSFAKIGKLNSWFKFYS